MEEKSGYFKRLRKEEKKSIIKVMAFMSYNPSIGRVLEKGGVKDFQNMAVRYSEKLSSIKAKEEFDRLHRKWIYEIIRKIKTNRGTKCSFGQAQKPINVFLKLYVYWANLPTRKCARKIRPFLHVPLDGIIMSNIKKDFQDFFKNTIRDIRDTEPNCSNSLSKVQKKEYYKWQKFFRQKCKSKPILFDTIWAIRRSRGG